MASILGYNKSMILGIDEAGRGPWAGPLVVGAVVLGGVDIAGLTDSKKLSKKRRQQLDLEIREKALGYGLGWVSAAELDEVGMSEALRRATIRAVEKVTCSYSEIIIDGTVNFLSLTTKGRYVKTMPRADLLIPSVSAASILAKQARDAYMIELAQEYPVYGFDAHMGYGTARHRAVIDEAGVTPEHRLSFAPLKRFREDSVVLESAGEDVDIVQAPLKTKQIGDAAESAVTAYLEKNGHIIIERNWRTRVCEIDIISTNAQCLYYTEVKYRRTNTWGDGVSAITPTKHGQMQYAARVYTARNNQYQYLSQRLAVASVYGEDFVVDQWFALD